MQAIARVNRVYPGKEGGLIVDYMGVGAELKKALMDYTESGGKSKPIFDQEKAGGTMQEKYEVVKDMFHGFEEKKFFELKPSERINFIPDAMEYILKRKGQKRKIRKRGNGAVKVILSVLFSDDKAMTDKRRSRSISGNKIYDKKNYGNRKRNTRREI